MAPAFAQVDAELPKDTSGYSSPVAVGDQIIGQTTLESSADTGLSVPVETPVGVWDDGARRAHSAHSLDARWSAGLAAWRSGDYGSAAAHFEAVATHDRASSWTGAAGAFWTARALLFDRRPDEAGRWLAVAADSGETFYGLLARRILGLPMVFNWDLTEDDRAALAAAQEQPDGQSALAAIEAGDYGRAERALRSLATSGSTELAHGAMIVAENAGMAEFAFRLHRQLVSSGIDFDRAAFPLPHWQPEGGFSTDRALIYALMRQESCFDPGAVSPAGARGVMQLMPATARFVARTTGFPAAAVQLRRPEVNIALGQRYVELLLADDTVGPDLFLLTAAWNGGPGNLERWRRDPQSYDDPLLFIESIPFGETRAFIEHVLANLWIYRDRLQQPSPSLDALAAGRWPSWDGGGATAVEIAEHEQD